MTVVVRAAAMTLAHVPDLIRYGSKPSRILAADPEGQAQQRLTAAYRSYPEAVAYLPNRVFVGAARPEVLWSAPRPAWNVEPNDASPRGKFGEILPQRGMYGLLRAVDRHSLVQLEQNFADRARASLAAHPLLAPHAERVEAASMVAVEDAVARGAIPLYDTGVVVGSVRADHEQDEALSAQVLLENLACKATATLAFHQVLETGSTDPGEIDYVIGCGEEAIGDRYQRGGGGLAKAVCEEVGAGRATGSDTKAFCCAPIHALVIAAALIEARVYDTVAVVAGGALSKLGMKASQALAKGIPILEDVLAGMAVLLSRADGASRGCARLRLDCVGRFSVDGGSSQQLLYEQVCVRPLAALGMRLLDVDRYSVELHDPEITAPAGGGDVARRNYRMLGGLAVLRKELRRDALDTFQREHGLPGYAPTQGHIASAVPWLPHALEEFRAGTLRRTMLVAKGSLFLGRLTQLWDGISVLIDNGGG